MHLGLKNKVQSELVRNSARLLSANIIAQAIGLLVYPILTRMYAPEDFGMLNLFMSIGGIFILICTADYQNAIVLPKEESRARALVQICGGLLLVMMAVLVLSIPFSKPIARLFNAPELARWWWLMPLYVGGLSGWAVISNYYIRHKSFRRMSVYQISQSILGAGGKLGFGVIGWLSGGLVVSTVFAPVLAIGASLLNGGRKLLSGIFEIDRSSIHAEAVAYRNFPLYSMPRSLVSTLCSNLPILMLTPVFGLTELGYFGMALTLAMRPLQMIVQSVYQVLLQRTAQLVNEKQEIGRLLFRFVTTAFAVLLPLFAGLYFILPWLAEMLLGDSWRISGEYIRLLLPWLLVMTSVAPIGFITDVFGQQRIAFAVEIIYLLLSVAALTIGIVIRDFQITILCYSLVNAIVIIGQMIWYIWLIRRYDHSLSGTESAE
ncbi:MAG: oligosaccharide flippase family protein [Paludibacteraceae bacterium]|nr:oligosaccharide flippase family protein [Paludibacteraceae bacterium]